jgi:hypothetical protein
VGNYAVMQNLDVHGTQSAFNLLNVVEALDLKSVMVKSGGGCREAPSGLLP